MWRMGPLNPVDPHFVAIDMAMTGVYSTRHVQTYHIIISNMG